MIMEVSRSQLSLRSLTLRNTCPFLLNSKGDIARFSVRLLATSSQVGKQAMTWAFNKPLSGSR